MFFSFQKLYFFNEYLKIIKISYTFVAVKKELNII